MIEARTGEGSFDPKLDRQICEAAWQGDADRVKELYSLGADIECFNEIGNNPLHLAIEQADYDLVKMLLDLGADVDRRTRDGGWTPLIHAVEVASDAAIQLSRPPDNRMIQLLLEHGADARQRSSDGATALDVAKGFINHEAVKILRDAGGEG